MVFIETLSHPIRMREGGTEMGYEINTVVERFRNQFGNVNVKEQKRL
jgi:hypothetical protein